MTRSVGTSPEEALAARAALRVSATVYGCTVAMAWGAAILLAAAVPIAALVNASKPARGR